MMSGPKVESRRATSIAFIEHVGPYDRIPWEEVMQRLYGWAKAQGVMPGFYPMAVYLDDPKRTPPERCRAEIAISFKGEGREQGGVKVRQLPEMKVAAVSHKGPGTEFANTYARLTGWIAEKGYEVSGPPIEVYTRKPKVEEGVTILYAKVMIPVR